MFDDLKEKYAEFVESLEEKGVPRPQLLVPLALIVLVVAVVFLVNPFVQQAISSAKTGSVVVSVRDQAGSPLANAFVELVYSANGSSFAQAVAGGDGRASFSGVPLDGSVEVRASASGFQSKSVALSPEGETVVNLAVVSPEKKEREFRVKVKSSEGAPVEFAYVTLSFDDGSSTGVFTDASGYAQFSLDKNYSHATVKVEAPGFVSLEKSVGAADLSSGVAEFAAEPVAQATSSPEAVKKGTFKVVVFSAGVPVKGARVKLVDLAANEFGAGITGDDGVAAFPGVVFGKQFVVSVSADGFLDKQSQDYVTFSFDGQSEQVFLERKMSGSTSMVSLVVEDEQGNAVAGAEASFFFKDSNKLARKEVSGEDGRVAFEAVKGVQFYVTVYKQGFLPGFLEAVKAGDSKKMVLREEVAGSVATLSVKV
ncbi:MAG: carboxypeptidase regulatory-like domain-containing protein, partial [Candidatus Norongarragalinales archaeon]